MEKMPKHLSKAKAFLDIAESSDARREAYKAAAEEIAAHKTETGESNARIAIRLGRGESTIDKLVQWRKSDYAAATPFLMDERATTRAALSHTKATLRDAPMEQIERIIDELPDERKRDIGAAAGDAYLGMRQAHDERERNLTEAERKAREARADGLITPVRKGMAGFTTMGIVAHLEQATEDLAEINRDSALTPDMARQIDEALEAFLTEFRFGRALLGEEVVD